MRDSVLFLCVLCLTVSQILGVFRCPPCNKSPRCPHLPDGCERVTLPCRCCEECARRIGQTCSAYSPRCAAGLMCMNRRGEALERVPRIMKTYHGICQNVVVQPVVMENTDIEERRIGSKHYKHRV
ncbi:insulin-like growth factor-binding protein 5 [Mizuhopecten yessoensis]|uniref:Insulin-like growth factor binding protein 5 n=1 Tax=Mizuhopecten yessoensis TaxID=6573 RepID=W0JDD8_MIZYE|nr:insulin-like growth factor-binding protein 5 [Mizuhopecten yessoensis]AHF95042.1 insulin-like growth factor binding protein 5 [Mizuhopecten yessoensis]AHF95043.1 insulin-like growth factor binding protein 5 [Mizuhopecten yessoensis]